MKKELTALPEQDGNEITIREGNALPLKEPVKFSISGDITAVTRYLEKRRIYVSPTDESITITDNDYQPVFDVLAVVTVNKESKFINLYVSPNDAYGTTVNAKLEDSNELKPFHINEAHFFNRKDLIKLIRFSKMYFTDAAMQDNLLTKLSNLNFQTQGNNQQASDTRGQKTQLYDKKLTSDLPGGFFLRMPIYKNQPAVKFYTELAFEESEGNIHFWLESIELKDLQKQLLDEIFAEQLTACEGLVIINQ